jgi:hypothetical protein
MGYPVGRFPRTGFHMHHAGFLPFPVSSLVMWWLFNVPLHRRILHLYLKLNDTPDASLTTTVVLTFLCLKVEAL